jgi:hypothetical protein
MNKVCFRFQITRVARATARVPAAFTAVAVIESVVLWWASARRAAGVSVTGRTARPAAASRLGAIGTGIARA